MFCITETHLIGKEDIDIEGYEPYRNDRNKDGGGILVGVRKPLDNIVTVVEKRKDIYESLWMVIPYLHWNQHVLYTPESDNQ